MSVLTQILANKWT